MMLAKSLTPVAKIPARPLVIEFYSKQHLTLISHIYMSHLQETCPIQLNSTKWLKFLIKITVRVSRTMGGFNWLLTNTQRGEVLI